MSVTFFGTRRDGTRVSIPFDHPAFFQLANGNAVRFVAFLGLGDALWGDVALPEARRAIIRARATFDRRVQTFTREGTHFKRPGRARIITAGIDQDYFERRLDDFERFVLFVAERGAVTICWG